MNSIKRVGIVAMPRISVGGGFAKVTRDLIAALNSMNKEVYLLTPFEADMAKIADLYGPVQIKKFFYPNKLKAFFSREEILGRKLIKKEFIRMAKEVDFIIDLDGGVLHRYLTDEQKKSYVIWRLSCMNPEAHKIQQVRNKKIILKIFIKRHIKNFSFSLKDIPAGIKIYPVDKWTSEEVKKFWKINTQDCLYPEIKVNEFLPSAKKKNQMVVLGRISPNKSIQDSIKIFAGATKNNPDYKLVILGGTTPDSEGYIIKLTQIVRELQITPNVEIIRNPGFDKIKKVLSESKFLIESQKGVSLTMTSIEALASGCIVLAYKNGGTFKEVLENGRHGYGFENIQEGTKILQRLVGKKRKIFDVKQSVRRAEFFSTEKFKKRLGKILQ